MFELDFDLPDTFDFGPMRVDRRTVVGFEVSLADAERIRINGGNMFSSVLLTRRVPAVLWSGYQTKHSVKQSTSKGQKAHQG